MTSKISPINDLDSSKFVFKGPKKEEDRYYIYITQKKTPESLPEKIYVQTPRLLVKSSMQESFADFTLPNALPFGSMMQEMDENILSIIKEKKEEWFQGQNIEDAFLDVGQTHSIKVTKDSSKIKLRVPKDTIAYNSKKEQIDLEEVSIDSEVTCILQLVGMWFTKTRWGVTWKTVQVKTHEKKKEPLRVYMFADEEVEDDEESLYPPPGV